MTIVAKQGKWDNAVYPWTDTTSAGYMGSIMAEIDAWISAISSNASIVANGMVPVKKRQPTDSTNGGVRNGFGYEFPDTSIGLNADGPTYPTLLVHGTEVNVTLEVGDGFEDDTQNDGFGDIYSGTLDGRGHSTSEGFTGDAGYDREAIVIYDDTDGAEFLAVGMKIGTGTQDSCGFAVFRDTDGHWCFVAEDGAFAYDTVLGYWTGIAGSYDSDPVIVVSSSAQRFLRVYASQATGAQSKANWDGAYQAYWYPATTALYGGRSTSANYGDYSFLPGNTEAIVELGYRTIAVRVPAS